MPIKLVARKNFTNSPKISNAFSKDAGKDGKPVLEHPMHVHKGCRFEIGPADMNVFQDMLDGMPDKQTIRELVSSRAVTIVEDTNLSKSIIKRIDGEVAEEKAAADGFKRRMEENRPATLKDVLAALPELIAQVGTGKAKG